MKTGLKPDGTKPIIERANTAQVESNILGNVACGYVTDKCKARYTHNFEFPPSPIL